MDEKKTAKITSINNLSAKLSTLKKLREGEVDKRGKPISYAELSRRAKYSDRHIQRVFDGDTLIHEELFIEIVHKGFKKSTNEAYLLWGSAHQEDIEKLWKCGNRDRYEISQILSKFTTRRVHVYKDTIMISFDYPIFNEGKYYSIYLKKDIHLDKISSIDQAIKKIRRITVGDDINRRGDIEISIQEIRVDFNLTNIQLAKLIIEVLKEASSIAWDKAISITHSNGKRIGPTIEINAYHLEDGISKEEANVLIKRWKKRHEREGELLFNYCLDLSKLNK